MEKDIELIINTNRKIRNNIFAYFIVVIFAFLGLKLLGIAGLIIGVILGVLANMINGSFQGVRVWNTCGKDYQYLTSKGYSSLEAVEIISKSFNKTLSDNFHKKVVEKFPTLDQIVVFYTGALPQNTKDEQWAIQCLEKTIIEKTPSGTYKARTKW